MSERSNQDKRREALLRERRLRRRKRRQQVLIMRGICLAVALVLVVGAALLLMRTIQKRMGISQGETAGEGRGETVTVTEASGGDETTSKPQDSAQTEAAEPQKDADALLEQAELMAAGYDYDGAIELLKTVPGYEDNTAVAAAITDFEAQKASCVAVDVTTVPHIFYHSLINNTDAAFNVSVLGQSQVDGMNAWMTTVEEFDKITQQMYDNGYVFVRLRDLVVETTDADGTVHFSPNTNLLLPPDKKPVVLSVDDLSYYHSYEAASYPDKLVLDENGKVKCHYVKPDGTEEVGDFDVVPRLNTFLEEHPDGAYKGARGMIALTGYNGVFGYRTDVDYRDKQNLMADQAKWLEEHPDFDWEADVAEAKVIAEALKEEGWEFASHTWGHLSVTNKTADELRVDNEKWVNTVENIVGPVDTIIFAHGNDIGTWEGYSDDNDKYRYFKDSGYDFYCNVDSSVPYWVQISDQYVRQGRIDLDGYLLYKASQGGTTVLDSMFNASEVFDQRRPTPVVANGEA